jgi:hypothetical protein
VSDKASITLMIEGGGDFAFSFPGNSSGQRIVRAPAVRREAVDWGLPHEMRQAECHATSTWPQTAADGGLGCVEPKI